ncbi:MAG: hypothetical protein ACLVAW_24140 [Eisenbergiella massiliensis]
MRTMFYEFPEQECCWDMKEQYMYGSDMLVAPVMYEDAVECQVYLLQAQSGRWYMTVRNTKAGRPLL